MGAEPETGDQEVVRVARADIRLAVSTMQEILDHCGNTRTEDNLATLIASLTAAQLRG